MVSIELVSLVISVLSFRIWNVLFPGRKIQFSFLFWFTVSLYVRSAHPSINISRSSFLIIIIIIILSVSFDSINDKNMRNIIIKDKLEEAVWRKIYKREQGRGGQRYKRSAYGKMKTGEGLF